MTLLRHRPVVTFLGLCVALGLIATFLWPTLRAPWTGDDTFNNYLDGWMQYEHLTAAQAFDRLFEMENLRRGHFYPIFSLLLFSEFHFIHSVVLMKVLVLVAIAVNALTLYVLL